MILEHFFSLLIMLVLCVTSVEYLDMIQDHKESQSNLNQITNTLVGLGYQLNIISYMRCERGKQLLRGTHLLL